MSPTRPLYRSKAYSSPVFSMSSARVKLLPPGAAQQSHTRSPGFAPTNWQASWADRSWTWNSPSWNWGSATGEPEPSSAAPQGRPPKGFIRQPWPSKAAARSSFVVRRGFSRRYSAGRFWKDSSSRAVKDFP